MPLWGRTPISARRDAAAWCEGNLFLGPEEVHPGPLRWQPWQREVLCDFSSGYNLQALMCASRLGKTKLMGGAWAYGVAGNPSIQLLAVPTQKDLDVMVKHCLVPYWRNSPVLQSKLQTNNRGRLSALPLQYDGGYTDGATSYSHSNFRGREAAVILVDELDVFRGTKDYANPLQMLDQRGAAQVGGAKMIVASTPQDEGMSLIETAYLSSSQGEFNWRCPACEGLFPPLWLDNITPDGKCACSICGYMLGEEQRIQAILNGQFVHDEPGNPRRSYHVSELSTIYNTLDFVITKYDEKSPRGFYTQSLGLPYKSQIYVPIETDHVERLYLPAPEGWHPNATTVGIDVQAHFLEYVIVEWMGGAEGFRARVIEHSRLERYPDNDEVWKRLESNLARYPLDMIFIDRRYRTNDVRAQVRRSMNRWVGPKKVRFVAGADPSATGRKMTDEIIMSEGGARDELDITVNRFPLNDWAYRIISEATPENGQFTVDAKHILEDFSRQLTSEEYRRIPQQNGIERERWIRKTGVPNEVWDCFCYALVARYKLGLSYNSLPIFTFGDMLQGIS